MPTGRMTCSVGACDVDAERAKASTGADDEEIVVLEEAQDPQVGHQARSQDPAPPARRRGGFQAQAHDEVDHRAGDDQSQEAHVPPAVEEVARREQYRVLQLQRRCLAGAAGRAANRSPGPSAETTRRQRSETARLSSVSLWGAWSATMTMSPARATSIRLATRWRKSPPGPLPATAFENQPDPAAGADLGARART